MPVARQKSKARPELLAWARKSARLDLETAAKKAGVKPEQIDAWEHGDDAPSIPQLRTLAEVYKRPLVVFFLASPPKDFDALRDFRRLPADAPTESPDLAAEMRWAHEMREIAIEVFSAVDEPIASFGVTAKLDDSIAVVADRLRAALGVTPEAIWPCNDGYEAYRMWRTALEENGVLVLQITGVEVSEARGFSIGLRPFPTVAVNAQDAVTARIFTMLHEVTHLALGATGTCDLHERGSQERDRIEMFCNAVAGEVLVPVGYLRREPEVRKVRSPIDWSDAALRDLAMKYRVSREVILRRFLNMGLASQAFYRRKHEEFAQAEGPDVSGGDFYRNRRAKYGMPLIRGVLRAWDAGQITANEAAAYLHVKVESLGRLGGREAGRT